MSHSTRYSNDKWSAKACDTFLVTKSGSIIIVEKTVPLMVLLLFLILLKQNIWNWFNIIFFWRISTTWHKIDSTVSVLTGCCFYLLFWQAIMNVAVNDIPVVELLLFNSIKIVITLPLNQSTNPKSWRCLNTLIVLW